MNLKPFNLEKALAGNPVVTRAGEKVLDLHYFKDVQNSENLYASVLSESGEVELYAYFEEGVYIKRTESDEDLFMAPNIKKYYMGIVKSAPGSISRYTNTYLYASYQEAYNACSHDKFNIIEVEVEE